MIRCEKCEEPCGTEIVYSEESHGFSYGPREQWSAEVSDCCGAETYEDGKSEPDELDREARAFAEMIFAYGVALSKKRGEENAE